jgi:hypothetical protein
LLYKGAVALKGTYEAVKQAIQDLIAPQLQELKGEITGLRGEFKSEVVGLRGEFKGEIGELKSEVAGLRGELKGEIGGLRGEMRQLEKRMEEGFASLNQRIDASNKCIDEALEIRERLAAVEAKLAARPN